MIRYPNSPVNHFVYPHADGFVFPKISQAVRKSGFTRAYCIWRSKNENTGYDYNLVVNQQYEIVPKEVLSKIITQNFNDYYINYIVPFENWRVYASFNNEDEMIVPFNVITDARTVIQKYQVIDYIDDWGLYVN